MSLKLLSVNEFSLLTGISEKTIYTYVCNSGVKGGPRKKRFPSEIYVRIGRRVMFIEQRVNEWILSGAQLV